MENLGFIGLGIMGTPMATHLIEAGNKVALYDKIESRISQLVVKGGIACKNCREVAEKSNVVFLMLPDTKDVEEALFGQDGVIYGIKKESIVVDMSSISPTATKIFAERLRSVGVEMLDAPVSGGEIGAINATLSIMVGGKKDAFEKIKPHFELMGKNIVHIGDNGHGQICKVANQIIVASTIETVAEALVFASKAGADASKVREALLGGFAGSKILEIHGERMIKKKFEPGFRIRLHQKDLNIALQVARELGIALPGAALALQFFNAVAAEEGSELDHSALVKVLEKLANHEIKDKD